MKQDSAFRFERQMRCRIYHAMIASNLTKRGRTIDYLGCTASFFREWMAFQLYDGMTLENYGKVWHVDHTRPVAHFRLEVEQECRACFSWVNCRPLLASKNLRKKCSYRPFDAVLQDLKARFFLKHVRESR